MIVYDMLHITLFGLPLDLGRRLILVLEEVLPPVSIPKASN